MKNAFGHRVRDCDPGHGEHNSGAFLIIFIRSRFSSLEEMNFDFLRSDEDPLDSLLDNLSVSGVMRILLRFMGAT